MNYIFFGTPQFAVIILKALIEAGHKPALIVAAPDKPKGRGRALTPPPVKICAEQYGASIIQPATLKDAETTRAIAACAPDLFIVAAYGKIIPKTLLDIPKKGNINVHPSLLPNYRGPSPIQAAILNGDETTWVTIMLMDEKMDHGPILAQQELALNIISNITTEKLSDELAKIGSHLLIETIPKWLAGDIAPQEQDHSKATYTKMITKEDGHIDWRKSAEEIERMVRAYTPWPSAWTIMSDLQGLTKKEIRVKILKSRIFENKNKVLTSTIAKRDPLVHGAIIKQKSDLLVACGNGFLIVEELQVEGKKPMSGREFLNAYPFGRLFSSVLLEDHRQLSQ